MTRCHKKKDIKLYRVSYIKGRQYDDLFGLA